jgi:hypothetical protein
MEVWIGTRAERKAGRLGQQVGCEREREERRLHALARWLGHGRVRFPRRDCDSVGAAAAVGRGGNKPGICREMNR